MNDHEMGLNGRYETKKDRSQITKVLEGRGGGYGSHLLARGGVTKKAASESDDKLNRSLGGGSDRTGSRG